MNGFAKTMEATERHTLNAKHAAEPKIGDYWHDMYCPVGVVVDVSDFTVVVLDTKKEVGDRKWTWDTDAEPKTYSRKEYKYRYTYGKIHDPNYSGDGTRDHDNKHWADVMPEHMKWVREALLEGKENGN